MGLLKAASVKQVICQSYRIGLGTVVGMVHLPSTSPRQRELSSLNHIVYILIRDVKSACSQSLRQ